jgi:RNA polymerase sigma-70 factor (ECF subfamily)
MGRPTPEDRSDAELWLEAVSGTSASFTAIYTRYKLRVFRKAYFRAQNISDAEDITAMVFLEAWRSRDKVRIVDGSLLPWLLVVTSNVSLNSERARRRYRRLLSRLPPAGDEVDPSELAGERLDRRKRSYALTAALERLNRSERIVVDLCLIEELTLSTAANVLDIPVGTVKSRLHSARRKLRTYLADPDIHLKESGTPNPEDSGDDTTERRNP